MDLITYNTLRSKRYINSTYNYYFPHYCPAPQSVIIRPRPLTAVLSAYDIAVKHGFKGTEQDWLNSLVPTIGSNGNWFINGKDTGISAVGSGDGSWTKDYNVLLNKPTINGLVLQGDIEIPTISNEEIDQLFDE